MKKHTEGNKQFGVMAAGSSVETTTTPSHQYRIKLIYGR
jgi:hypothetical protein